jgi:glucose-6-phosphate 1-dehydrogenase
MNGPIRRARLTPNGKNRESPEIERPSWVNDEKVPGYREEDGVAPNSQTETFVALRLYVDNWRWQDVPFYSALESALPGRPRKSRFSFAACRISPFRQRPRSIGSPPAGHVDSAR